MARALTGDHVSRKGNMVRPSTRPFVKVLVRHITSRGIEPVDVVKSSAIRGIVAVSLVGGTTSDGALVQGADIVLDLGWLDPKVIGA